MADSRMASGDRYAWKCPMRRSRFEAMYKQATECEDAAKLVCLVYTTIDILLADGAAYSQHLKPEHMGVHPANRAGKKMVDLSMQKKGFKIWKAGFSLKLCPKEKAVAFEDNPSTLAAEKHTIAITSRSQLFGQYLPGSVQAGSVGASHLNQWLHAATSGAQSQYTELCDKGSDRISRGMAEGQNDDLRVSFLKGLEWTMIKWQIAEMYPLLPSWFQRALNIEHHIGQGDVSK